MNSTHLATRRTFLTFELGIGTLALSACAPSTRTKEKPSPSYPSPTQSFVREPEYGYGYDGIIRLDNYEKSGKYTPATHDHKALNVPKPLKPELHLTAKRDHRPGGEGRHAGEDGCQVEHPLVGVLRPEILFHEQLHAVDERLGIEDRKSVV